jgi:hypothetical protein
VRARATATHGRARESERYDDDGRRSARRRGGPPRRPLRGRGQPQPAGEQGDRRPFCPAAALIDDAASCSTTWPPPSCSSAATSATRPPPTAPRPAGQSAPLRIAPRALSGAAPIGA